MSVVAAKPGTAKQAFWNRQRGLQDRDKGLPAGASASKSRLKSKLAGLRSSDLWTLGTTAYTVGVAAAGSVAEHTVWFGEPAGVILGAALADWVGRNGKPWQKAVAVTLVAGMALGDIAGALFTHGPIPDLPHVAYHLFHLPFYAGLIYSILRQGAAKPKQASVQDRPGDC